MTTTAIFVASFLASALESVEALTVLIALAFVRSWRPVIYGAGAALILLGAAGGSLGAAMGLVPERALQLAVGLLLALVAASWLIKSAKRITGRRSGRDQAARFTQHRTRLEENQLTNQQSSAAADWITGIAAFKAVLLDGLEVIFVVIGLGGANAPEAAISGALLGAALIFTIGAALRRPLARLPEDAIMFWTSALLLAFATRWVAAGINVDWVWGELAVAATTGFFAGAAWLGARFGDDYQKQEKSPEMTNSAHQSAAEDHGAAKLAAAVASKLARLIWADRWVALGLVGTIIIVAAATSIWAYLFSASPVWMVTLLIFGLGFVVMRGASR
ncbi:hypothetical protein [Pseudaestuariivita rosea]|uniref:hypothetical protein n=1 Tax=Pseudaestuariivita rosea TaxID=2763263 RepID=UPI001ABA1962|nr:hypothetical protein [Pseudaestuariivita rosea]